MPCEFPWSPFIAFRGGDSQLGGTDPSKDTHGLDYLGYATPKDLCWNPNIASMGVICGPFVNETNIILQRLMGSHMSDPTAELVLVHTDYFSLRETPCALLNLLWPRLRILVSPNTAEEVVHRYKASGNSAARINFRASCVTLRHVLAIFTPPKEMEGGPAILETVRLILSQLREPFELQRFIELAEQEKWTEDGVNFMALRQTLLTKLLAPSSENVYEDGARKIRFIDLTDPVLQGTGLDCSIMDIALYDFLQTDGKKMIVLTNCQQYLTPASSLVRTLENLASLGVDRPASVILCTTDPSMIPLTIFNSLDYVMSGSSRSLRWNAFLRQHYPIPMARSKPNIAIIWSAQSVTRVLEESEDECEQPWGDDVVAVDIQELLRTMPMYSQPVNLEEPVTGEGIGPTTEKVPEDLGILNHSISQAITPPRSSRGGEEEEGMIPMRQLGMKEGSAAGDDRLGEPPTKMTAPPVSSKSEGSASSPGVPSEDLHKFHPLVSAISMLGGGSPGSLVTYKDVKKQMGKKKKIQSLGWDSFSELVILATQAKVVERIDADPDTIFLTLAPSCPAYPWSPLISLVPLKEEEENIESHSNNPRTPTDDCSHPNGSASINSRMNPRDFAVQDPSMHLIPVLPNLPLCPDSPPSRSMDASMPQPPATVASDHLSPMPPPHVIRDPPLRTVTVQDAPTTQSNDHPVPSVPFVATEFPLSHRPVVSAIIELTRGVRGMETEMATVMGVLQREYPHAREQFLLSLITKAGSEGVVGQRSYAGVEFMSLVDPVATPVPVSEPPAVVESVTHAIVADPPPHTILAADTVVVDESNPPQVAMPGIANNPIARGLLVAAVSKLTGGRPRVPVQMYRVIYSLVTDPLFPEYQMKELYPLSAFWDPDVVDCSFKSGVWWISLHDPAAGTVSTANTTRAPDEPRASPGVALGKDDQPHSPVPIDARILQDPSRPVSGAELSEVGPSSLSNNVHQTVAAPTDDFDPLEGSSCASLEPPPPSTSNPTTRALERKRKSKGQRRDEKIARRQRAKIASKALARKKGTMPPAPKRAKHQPSRSVRKQSTRSIVKAEIARARDLKHARYID